MEKYQPPPPPKEKSQSARKNITPCKSFNNHKKASTTMIIKPQPPTLERFSISPKNP